MSKSLKGIYENFKSMFRWILIAVITGLVVGGIGTLFAAAMNFVTDFRMNHDFITYMLPLGGILIVALYSLANYKNDKGTDLVLSTIHAKSEMPFRMAPLIVVSTVITHLFGGSAGREGAALQLGGSVGNQLGRWFRLDEQDVRVVVMCGMSAAFSALFGTPMAAAIFAIEVASIGIMYYAALVPCIFAALVASQFAAGMGIHPESFTIVSIPAISIPGALKIILLGICCAGASTLFIIVLHRAGDYYRKYFENPYIRVIVGSLLVIALTFLVQSKDYLGAGIPVIERAMEGKVFPIAFLLKIIFTALTLGAGFKGGEIVPSFFIGATLGCAFGQLLGISPSLCAACGTTAVFCGVTNCPITSLLISFELFGYEGVPYFLMVIAISYMLSGYYSLYHTQKIVYSKHKAKYVNQEAKR